VLYAKNVEYVQLLCLRMLGEYRHLAAQFGESVGYREAGHTEADYGNL
jgi:hypothetical protein